MTLLNVENLSVSFKNRDGIIDAVKNVSFSVDSGEILGIVGESGSGKSVCCYTIMGLIENNESTIKSGSILTNPVFSASSKSLYSKEISIEHIKERLIIRSAKSLLMRINIILRKLN